MSRFCYFFGVTNKPPQLTPEELADRGMCLICGEQKPEKYRRGMCAKDYQNFIRKRSEMSPEGADDYEAELVQAGLLLPNRQGQRPKSETILDKIAKKYLPDDGKADTTAALNANDRMREIEREVFRPKTTKKKPKK